MEREPIIGWVRFAGFSDVQIATQTEGIGPWHWRPAVDCHLDLAVIRFGWVVDGPKSNNEGQLLLGPVFFFFLELIFFIYIYIILKKKKKKKKNLWGVKGGYNK